MSEPIVSVPSVIRLRLPPPPPLSLSPHPAASSAAASRAPNASRIRVLPIFKAPLRRSCRPIVRQVAGHGRSSDASERGARVVQLGTDREETQPLLEWQTSQ